MESIIEKALNGNKVAVTTLYNNNKDQTYALTYCLLQDKLKAEKIVIDIFSTIWSKLSSNIIKTEKEFSALCLYNALNECKKVISKTDSKAFQSPKNKNFIINSDRKASTWIEAISDFSTLQKFVFITHILCNIPREQIAKIVCVDLTTINFMIEAEKINLDKIWNYCDVENDLKKDNNSYRFQPNDISPILSAIENYVEPFEKKALVKKIRILSVVLAVLIVGAVIFGLVILIKDGKYTSTSSTNNNSSDTNVSSQSSAVTIDKWATSVTATDYAVIDIKDYGKISIALDSKTAPITVENFINLANKGFYDGLTFHRIMEGFMMQGGDPNGNGTGGSDKEIKGEFSQNGVKNNLSHVRGAISMARSTPFDSASSQFFIVHKDSIFLDNQYAAFGYVVDGMDIVDEICEKSAPTDDNGTIPSAKQPIINSVKIYSVEEFENDSQISLESQSGLSSTVDSEENESIAISTEASKENVSEGASSEA